MSLVGERPPALPPLRSGWTRPPAQRDVPLNDFGYMPILVSRYPICVPFLTQNTVSMLGLISDKQAGRVSHSFILRMPYSNVCLFGA